MIRSVLPFMILACAFFTQLCAQAEQRILLLGDSLSAGYGMKQDQGWVKLLQDKYRESGEPVTLINASISGETSGGALRRLPGLLKEHQPSHVLIEIGGNDGLRGFPVKKLHANLMSLVTLSQQHNARAALMQIHIPPNYGPRYTAQFDAVYPKVSNATQATLMPFFITSIAQDPTQMQADNIHPKASAQATLRDLMYEQIKSWLSKD